MAFNTGSIEKLTSALSNVLKASDGAAADKAVAPAIMEVIRELQIVRELNERYYIAVAGSQGAGKTRLMRELYALDRTWLDDNEGRGEKMPVFIVEQEGIDVPQGVVQCIDPQTGHLYEKPLQPAEFRARITGWGDDSGKNELLPRLLVPSRHFNGSKVGFVLLPGYEIENEQNTAWQKLMRRTLRLALGTVVVTDAARLAESSQREIAEDLARTCLAMRKPMIVASKTENLTPVARADIAKRAAQVFGVPEHERNRIVTAGVGAAYVADWSAALIAGLGHYALRAADSTELRIDDLLDLLDVELPGLQELIESSLVDKELGNSVAERHRSVIVEHFDAAAKKYRRNYERELRTQTRLYANRARETARARYQQEEVGIGNKVRHLKNFLSLRSGAREEAHIRRIVDSWRDPGGEGVKSLLESDFGVLSRMTESHLEIDSPAADGRITDTSMLPLLGYKNGEVTSSDAASWTAPHVPAGLRRVLTLPRKDAAVPAAISHDEHEALQRVVELIPAITMEFVRINQAMIVSEPDLRARLDTLQASDKAAAAQKLGDAARNLRGQVELNDSLKRMLRAVGCILAVDVAIDGTVDTVPSLIDAIFGTATTAAGAGATASLIASGVLAAGFLLHSAIREVHQYDAARSGYINTVMDHLSNEHVAHQLEVFDQLMERIGERMHRALAAAYRLDVSAGFRDHLLRCLAAVERARLNLMSDVRDRQVLA
ncbi:hypothetical protein CR51_31175 [Caballeronia megalochromosomata]|nr:hypothetical protein CR51_31175 [Caballeronia megalochromosomata]